MGVPVASPHIGQVLCYLNAIFKLSTELMNGGKDMSTALREAWKDAETKTVHFHDQVSIAIHTPECRAMTAPDLQERARPASSSKGDGRAPQGAQLALEDGHVNASAKTAKNRAKRLKQKAHIADLRAVVKDKHKPGGKPSGRLAILDKDRGNGGGAKGKGKGKAGKQKDKMDSGESICFNWNKGKPCVVQDCPHKHVCRICESDSHAAKDHTAANSK